MLFRSGVSCRVEAASISKQGRASTGVKVIDIKDPDYVIGIDRIAREDEAKEAIPAATTDDSTSDPPQVTDDSETANDSTDDGEKPTEDSED